MLYTVISDYKKLLPEILNEEGGIDSPFSLLPRELKQYIKEPKNEEARLSRLGGYLLLFHTVRFLFGEIDFSVGFSEKGKPYFTGEGMKNISFNISHSAGLCAVTVSDEPCHVGVDIQEDIEPEREEKLKKRFCCKELKAEKNAEPLYLFGGFFAYGDCMFAEIPASSLKEGDTKDDFTDMWSLSEALMKCDGRGFGAIKDVEKILKDAASGTVKLSYRGRKYSVSTAIM